MADENGSDRKPTERVILEEIAVLVLPRDADPEKVEEAIKLLGIRRRGRPVLEVAWREVSRQVGTSKANAVEGYAGKPGTPDAKVGTFRAPTVTSWKDAQVYEAPPAPLVERRVVE